MKYFSPNYWFKLWVLSAPLFNDKTQGINAKWIDNNEKIKNWASNNTNLQSINQDINFTNLNTNYQPYNLNQQLPNQNINPIYQTELEATTHKHRHQKSRNERDLNGDTLIEFDWNISPFTQFVGTGYASFTPEFFEEMIDLEFKYHDYRGYETNSTDPWYLSHYDGWKVVEIFNKKLNNVSKSYRIDSENKIDSFCFMLYRNWYEILQIWKNSDKQKRILITFECWEPGIDRSQLYAMKYKKTEIITSDTKIYNNKYLYNLQIDFPDYNNYEINLGVIKNNFENDIKNAIKQKYKNLIIDDIEIVNKKDYSHLCACFLKQIEIKRSSEKYSYGILKPQFSYTTETKINEINNIIKNDSKYKQWVNHLNDYNKNLPTKIEHLKSYTDSKKWIAKNTEKEIIKGYIRDWSYVSTLIEHELKIDELNKNVQGLRASFDSIKNQVNELDNRVTNLENTNTSNWNCANIVAFVGGAISLVPEIGTVGSAVATMTSSVCAIASV